MWVSHITLARCNTCITKYLLQVVDTIDGKSEEILWEFETAIYNATPTWNSLNVSSTQTTKYRHQSGSLETQSNPSNNDNDKITTMIKAERKSLP